MNCKPILIFTRKIVDFGGRGGGGAEHMPKCTLNALLSSTYIFTGVCQTYYSFCVCLVCVCLVCVCVCVCEETVCIYYVLVNSNQQLCVTPPPPPPFFRFLCRRRVPHCLALYEMPHGVYVKHLMTFFHTPMASIRHEKSKASSILLVGKKISIPSIVLCASIRFLCFGHLHTSPPPPPPPQPLISCHSISVSETHSINT